MKNKKKKKKKGSTLLEIVIALAIIGIMMLPLANSLLTSVKANKMGEEAQEAKLLGQQIAESLKGEESSSEIQRVILEIENDKNPTSLVINKNNFKIEEIKKSPKVQFKINNENINGYQVKGEVIREKKYEDIENYDEYLNQKLGGLIVINKDKIYYKTVAEEKKFCELYKEYKDNSDKSGVGIECFEFEIMDELDIVIKEEIDEIQFLSKAVELGKKKINKPNIAIAIEVPNTKVIEIINHGEQVNLFGFIQEDVPLENGFSSEMIDCTEGSFKKVQNIKYNSEQVIALAESGSGENIDKKRMYGLYTLNLDILNENKNIESTQVQFNIVK